MQFQHPNILYALFALLIPVLIHLFQLRKFEKVAFTNVTFLKQIVVQTRKSSQLKKWLVLCCRLLLFAAIIFAFSEPYFANFDTAKRDHETIVYIDNSFSMQAKGKKGMMFKSAIKDLIENYPENKKISLFTNDRTFKNTSLKAIKNDLLELDYSPKQLPYKTVFLKANELFSNDRFVQKEFLVISDFQKKKQPLSIVVDSLTNTHLIQLVPEQKNNISIDTIYIKDQDANTFVLAAKVNGTKNTVTPLSLFNGERLIAKASVSDNNTVEFNLNKEEELLGMLSLDDNALRFDNTFYFNINKPEKINVLVINEVQDDYLGRIFNDQEFNLSTYLKNEVDYNQIGSQNLIVLNELTSIPRPLINVINEYLNKGLQLLLIPAKEIDLTSYNTLTKNSFKSFIENEIRITSINYKHPIYKNVFEKQVSNFQFPKVTSYYTVSNFDSKVISFENKRPFLFKKEKMYCFTAALNKENSNFTSAPLIVPTLYNIAKNSYQLPQLYHVVGDENKFEIKATLNRDEILSLKNSSQQFIPQQQIKANTVSINTSEQPSNAGSYGIFKANTLLSSVSYNYNRDESVLSYLTLTDFVNDSVTLSSNLDFTLNEIKSKNQISELWKWFIIFALAFLLIEVLFLKYLK